MSIRPEKMGFQVKALSAMMFFGVFASFTWFGCGLFKPGEDDKPSGARLVQLTEDEQAKQTFEFKTLGLCASLERKENTSSKGDERISPDRFPVKLPFEVRFWRGSSCELTDGLRWVDPEVEVRLLPRFCPNCRDDFLVERSRDQLNSWGPTFQVVPRLKMPGKYRMVLKLYQDGKLLEEDSVVRVF